MRLAIVALAIVACGSQPKCALPPRAPGEPLLWKVSHGGAVVYFYGTIHDAGAERVPAAAWQALATSKRFVSELGDSEPDRDVLRDRARLPFGQVLDRLIPIDDWWDLVNALHGTIAEDELRHAQPWFAMTRLTEKLAPSPRPSMDVALADRAHALGLPIDPLESWDEQLATLQATVTPADLSEAIHARSEMACELDQLRADYDAGDVVRLTARLRVPKAAALITTRNARWLPKLAAYFTGDGAFVAVGAGHLLGDDGLLATLAKQGYSVERISTR